MTISRVLTSIFFFSSILSAANATAQCPIITNLETKAEVSRFLAQAGLGASAADLEYLVGTSAEDWIDTQFDNDPGTTSLFADNMPTTNFLADATYNFWNLLLDQDARDQALRHRMAFALAQILVVSDTAATSWWNIPYYQDRLFNGAFGTYRQMLNDVTYSPSMANYLTYLRNQEIGSRSADENYAREILQLFTIGLVELEEVGTEVRVKLDINGNEMPTYTNEDIEGLAKVFTGLSYWWAFNNDPMTTGPDENEGRFDYRPTPFHLRHYQKSLKMWNNHHSGAEKQFLGLTLDGTLPGEDPTGYVDILLALNHIENHSNVPYFIGRQLIQRFTASDPSDEYVIEVANAYKSGTYRNPDGTDMGDGTRGSLKAVLAAILLNPRIHESECANIKSQETGKAREPVLKMLHWAHAFGIDDVDIIVGGPLFEPKLKKFRYTGGTDTLAQHPYGSPSVFNFYRPGFKAPGSLTAAADMTVPEFQIVNGGSRAGFLNYMYDFVFGLIDDFEPDYSEMEAIVAAAATDAEKVTNLIAHLNEVLTGNSMSDREILKLENVLTNYFNNFSSQNHLVELAVLLVVSTTSFSILN